MDGSLKIPPLQLLGREINGRHPEARHGIQRPVFHTQVVLENYDQFFAVASPMVVASWN
jgi:hypothetical protein